jgi:bifunctional non-homologous end joining protein LigD
LASAPFLRNDAGELIFAGNVGTGKGFTADYLSEVRRGLATIEQTECPFAQLPPADVVKRAHWMRPVLSCEVSFIEFTDEGHVRHPSFLGFRPGH